MLLQTLVDEFLCGPKLDFSWVGTWLWNVGLCGKRRLTSLVTTRLRPLLTRLSCSFRQAPT